MYGIDQLTARQADVATCSLSFYCDRVTEAHDESRLPSLTQAHPTPRPVNMVVSPDCEYMRGCVDVFLKLAACVDDAGNAVLISILIA